MTPVIRIDDEVLSELEKWAIKFGKVFGTPNDILRGVLGLDRKELPELPIKKEIVIELKKYFLKYQLIYIPKSERRFFPGYKIDFELIAGGETLVTHVTSNLDGTPIGEPDGGHYIRAKVYQWYLKHPELKIGNKLRIEALEPGKRYRLSIAKA